MEGAGRQGIAGRLASTLGALAVDFGNRDLGLLGIARVGISYASWCLAIALGVYGFEVGGAVAVGVVALVRLLPGALASPFAGLLGDRFPRRIGPDRQRPGGHRRPRRHLRRGGDGRAAGVVAILAGIFTAAISGYVPAESALLPALARSPQELSAANVTHSAMDNVGFLAAALTTGLLLHSAGPATVFGVGRRGRPDHDRRADPDRARRAPRLRGRRGALGASGASRCSASARWSPTPACACSAALLVVLVFFEGTAEVLVVILALDLLHLDHGSVGYLNAAWGIGALLGGATLVGDARAAGGSRSGSRSAAAVIGLATALPALWTRRRRLRRLAAIGLGYTVVEVAAKTLLQRLGSDETLGRVIGSLESARLAAMALGSIGASVFFELLGIRGALLALGGAAAGLRRPHAGPGCGPSRSAPRSPRSSSSCCAATRSSRRCRWRRWSGSATTWSP